MGFKPRALISNNHRSTNNPTDPTTTNRQPPIMAIGPSVFSSIPQFQQDLGRRGLNWGDAVADARWTSGMHPTSTASRQAGPSKLALAVLSHNQRKSVVFKPSTDYPSQSGIQEASQIEFSNSDSSMLRPEGSSGGTLPPLVPPRTYRNPLLPADNNNMVTMCRNAINNGDAYGSSSSSAYTLGVTSPPPQAIQPLASVGDGGAPSPQHQHTVSSSILMPLLRTPQSRSQPPLQHHLQPSTKAKVGSKKGGGGGVKHGMSNVRSTPLGRHPTGTTKSLEDSHTMNALNTPALWNVLGLRGWCIDRLILTTPQMSQGVLTRFLTPESSSVDADVLRLHVASTSVAIQDIITKAASGELKGASKTSGSTRPSGLQLLDASSLFVPGVSDQQLPPNNSSSRGGGPPSLPAIPQQHQSPSGGGMSLGSLLFPSPSPTTQGVTSLGTVQPANWERPLNATTLSELALENVGRREGMRRGVLDRSAGGGGGGQFKHSIYSDTPFTSTRPLHSALVTRALRELEAMTEAGFTMVDGGGAASTGRARALAACQSFLVPSAETLSVSVVGVLWVLENEFDVRCKSLQRALAEVLTSQYMISLGDGGTTPTKPRRRTTSVDGKPKPTKLQDLKFSELVRRDKAFYTRDVVGADTSSAVASPPPAAQDATEDTTTTTTITTSSSPKRAKVRANLGPLARGKYLQESEACLFGVLPAARVDVRWVVGLLDRYLNDHLSSKTPTRLSVPTPNVHNSYKCLSSIFAQFDISRRRCVKTMSLRDVKTQSVSVRVRGSGSSSNADGAASKASHSKDIIAHATSRVEAMYKVLSGMPRPDRGVFLSAYGHAPLAEGEGAPSSLVLTSSSSGEDGDNLPTTASIITTAASMTTIVSSIPRTRLPSRRALTALLYLFQQVYPVCTTTCSEEQFIASYVAGSYFEASTCTSSNDTANAVEGDNGGEEQKTDKGSDVENGDDEEASSSSSPQPKKGSVFVLPSNNNKSCPNIDITFVKTVEYYAADMAGHWLEGGGQKSVRAVASRLNSHHGGSSSSLSSKPPVVNKDMLVSIMGDAGVVKRAPKGALGDGDGGSNMKPKHLLPPPPLPTSVTPQSPEASSLRQLPAVLLSAFTSDIIKFIMQEEYGYEEDELLPQVVELDWIVS